MALSATLTNMLDVVDDKSHQVLLSLALITDYVCSKTGDLMER
jgi:hypothetical protein